jgi:hypothetical protein
MIGWTIGDRVHQKTSAQKVTHPSAIQRWASLQGIQVQAFGYIHPSDPTLLYHSQICELSHFLYKIRCCRFTLPFWWHRRHL